MTIKNKVAAAERKLADLLDADGSCRLCAARREQGIQIVNVAAEPKPSSPVLCEVVGPATCPVCGAALPITIIEAHTIETVRPQGE